MKKGGGGPEEILAQLFGSASRARILCFLHAFLGQNFYQREIMSETGLSLRPIQREVNNLVKLGVVKKQKTRNRVYYGINTNSPFLAPLVQCAARFSKPILLSQSDFISKSKMGGVRRLRNGAEALKTL